VLGALRSLVRDLASITPVGRRVLVVVAACAALVGCGGGSPGTEGQSPTPTATVGATVAPPSVTPPKTPFKATLTAGGHRPKAGRPWQFVVKARNLDGSPVSGTVKAQVLLGGAVVDTIGWFGFDGTLKHTITWSPDKRHQPLVFRAGVNANGGTKNLDYEITVQ
jgi:hypothetical protein